MRSLFLRLLFILFLSFTGSKLAGQHLELRLIPQKDVKVQVWLRTGIFQEGEPLVLAIKNKKETLLRSKGFVLAQDSTSTLLWELSLPQGGYTASLRSEHPPFREAKASINVPPQDLPLASSLVLSLEAIEDPGKVISHIPVYQSSAGMLHFSIAYRQCPQDQLSVRAILYKAERGNQEPTYASMEQIAAVFRLKDGSASFRGRFALDSLEAGSYLIEVLAYEDDRIIPELERSQEFSIRWSGLQALLDSPAQAIQRMRYLAGEKWVAEKLQLDRKKQREALLTYWQRHDPGEYELMMARYFQRLLTAEARFSPLQTSLCRTYALYGKAQVRRFTNGNNEFQRWFYPQTGVIFLFKRRKSGADSGLFELVH